jgi:hypothetical protein
MKTLLPSRTVLPAYFIGALAVFCLVIGMIRITYRSTRPPDVDHARFEERRKNLADLRAQTQQQLEHYRWINPVTQQVGLPLDRAIELVVQEWQDPITGRSNLLARSKAAHAATTTPKP